MHSAKCIRSVIDMILFLSRYSQTEITQIIHCQCLAIDLRGHGDSVVLDEDDLSAETLAK